MAIKFLADPDGSFLLVEPGSALLVEGDLPVFAYKTVEVGSRISRVSVPARPGMGVSVGAQPRRVKVRGL
jgi:hypothetical protein